MITAMGTAPDPIKKISATIPVTTSQRYHPSMMEVLIIRHCMDIFLRKIKRLARAAKGTRRGLVGVIVPLTRKCARATVSAQRMPDGLHQHSLERRCGHAPLIKACERRILLNW